MFLFRYFSVRLLKQHSRHRDPEMADDSKPKTKMVGKWYFGGMASSCAACCTHPLDLLKVRRNHCTLHHIHRPGGGRRGLLKTVIFEVFFNVSFLSSILV